MMAAASAASRIRQTRLASNNSMSNAMKSYATPWNGQLILACRKCQKKLKGDPDLRPLAKLKKTIKRYSTKHPDRPLHVINVPCMNLCPKKGVTVCNPAIRSNSLSILRSKHDIEKVFSRMSLRMEPQIESRLEV
jgi:hypothetical protein